MPHQIGWRATKGRLPAAPLERDRTVGGFPTGWAASLIDAGQPHPSICAWGAWSTAAGRRRVGDTAPVGVNIDWLDGFCRQQLGAGVADVIFEAGHLGVVLGAALTDGRNVMVKQGEPHQRLDACSEVQSALAAKGFPCPTPFLSPTVWLGSVVTVEDFISGGALLPSTGRDPAPFADALASVVALAPTTDPGRLTPPPPWNGGDTTRSELWPPPDDIDRDLNAIAGPAWLDDVASAAWARLRAADDLPVVVGHGDWYTGNLRWDGGRLRVAYDWDSAIAAPEADIAGFAAAVYPANGLGSEATLAETTAFLSAYERARGQVLSATEHERFWAAGLRVRSFDAKKQAQRRQPLRTLTRDEAFQRRSHINP